MCPPCGLSYSRIVRVETLSIDMATVLAPRNISSTFPCFGAAPGGVLKGDETAEDRIMNEYDAVDIEDRKKLYDYFHDDLTLFDYKWNYTNNKIDWIN